MEPARWRILSQTAFQSVGLRACFVFASVLVGIEIMGTLSLTRRSWAQDVIRKDAVADSNKTGKKSDTEKDDETYSTRLFVSDVDGSEFKQLAVFPGYTSQGSPEWSRDGKSICFDVWKMGGNVSTGEVALVNSDGTNPRTISDGLMPSFSPGGKRIAFSRAGANRGVWIMSTEGPETELVQIDENGWGTSWASDGRLAYTSPTPGGDNIVILNIVEGTREYVFDEQNSPYQQIFWNFAWSPDSKQIVFKGSKKDGTKEVGIVDSRGVKFGLIVFDLPDAHESFTWSPDSSRILVTKPCPERENRSQVYSLRAEKGATLELLPKQPENRRSTTAAWSPDGKRLVISTGMPVMSKAEVGKPASSAAEKK